MLLLSKGKSHKNPIKPPFSYGFPMFFAAFTQEAIVLPPGPPGSRHRHAHDVGDHAQGARIAGGPHRDGIQSHTLGTLTFNILHVYIS